MKWHKTRGVSRRAFLGGAGTIVALPFLESLWPVRTGRSVQTEPSLGFGLNKRTLFFYVPNGIHMASWTPGSTGADYVLPPILTPLEPYRQDMLVLSGISNMPAHPDGPGAVSYTHLTLPTIYSV